MFLRKYWKPLLTVLLVAIAGVSLYWTKTQPPPEPIVIYTPVESLPKSTETEGSVEETSQGGHFHADGTWHAEPHKAETPQEAFHPEMSEKATRLKQERDALQTKLNTLKARDPELKRFVKPIREKLKEITETYAVVLAMTPEKFLALSGKDQDDFLLLCVKYDQEVEALQEIVTSTPSWALDFIFEDRPSVLDRFRNAPSATLIYRSLL